MVERDSNMQVLPPGSATQGGNDPGPAPSVGAVPSVAVETRAGQTGDQKAVGGAAGSVELRSLPQQIHDHVLGKILRRELVPGERISPPEIAAALGVSVTPVRDAVNLLASEGLVSVRPRHRTIVSPVSAENIAELYEIRLMIEPAAAELVAGRATEADIQRIRALAERLDASPTAPEGTVTAVEEYLAELSLDADFHAELIRAVGNRNLTTLYQGLSSHVLVARTSFPTLNRSRPGRRGEHLSVVVAIEARDGAQARAAMTMHLRHALADALHRISESEASLERGVERVGIR